MSELIHDHVDESRLRTDIETTAGFGEITDVPGRGRTVLTGTEADRRAREYFVDRLKDAKLDVRVDEVGNIVGRWTPNDSGPTRKAVAAGSHLDSVIEGGIFDGVLGVYGALESIRAMQDAGATPPRPLEVVAFTEEEGGRFSDGVLGSSVASDNTDLEAVLDAEDDDGITLADALDEIGFRGSGRLDATEWDAWLELHVEQSTRLEAAEVSTGIVTKITGTVRSHVEIIGEANHAGTTSMRNRRDALTAASELTIAVESIVNEVAKTESETAVATVGQHSIEPNSINVIPGRVCLGIDVRDVRPESLSKIIERIRRHISTIEEDRGVEISYAQPYKVAPSEMSPRCTEQIREAAEHVEVDAIEIHSGAGHDTMQLTDSTDVGMLFARSVDGISHSPREQTTWDDCAETTRVLAQALWGLANSR
jgi:N-carbamoyl-L-amino-acid hydrolase